MNSIKILSRILTSGLQKLGNFSIKKKVSIITLMIKTLLSLEKNPSDSLKFLLSLDRKIYSLTGRATKNYEGGLHAKHRLTKYHDFFIKNINDGDHILDLGCGNGFLSYNIVTSVKNVKLLGIDLSKSYIDFAEKHYQHTNLKFLVGNALTDLPEEKFDVIILSNVLEHIEHRVKFLAQIKNRIGPTKYLLRVPLFERDWRVPLMKELGMDYRLDKTHYIEYTQEIFFDELKKAGLRIETHEIRWGEIWSVVKPI
ncbi:MAG: class I SAM-dependent methyltransferase [Promethearchaeota archaeon]|jgi:SAM-dependent methyltransferase